MKSKSFQIAGAFLALSSYTLPFNVLAQEESQTPHKKGKFLRKKSTPLVHALFQQQVTSSSFSSESSRRVHVQYRDIEGESIAKECADKIIHDPAGTSTMVLEAHLECLEALEAAGQLEHAEIDYPTRAISSQEDHLNIRQRRSLNEILSPGLEMIQADQLEKGDNEIIVCIGDTGIQLDHPEFADAGNRITGEDTVQFFGERWKWNKDYVGHGTHVAGVIAASANNGSGIRGAGNFRLHIVRALDDYGDGFDSDLRNAIQQCVDAGANIINLSLGMSYLSTMTDQLLKDVANQGILVVAPAGNDGQNADVYPASHPSVLSVMAVKNDGSRWNRSNSGGQIELAGPGVDILSTSTSEEAVTTPTFSYEATHVGTPAVPALTRTLHDCGTGSGRRCLGATGKICLMRVRTSSEEEIRGLFRNCERGGGLGAVLYGGADADDARYNQPTSLALVVHTSVTSGNVLKNDSVGQVVTIGDKGDDGVEATYKDMTGTSVASSHVAAAAALVWSHFGTDECSSRQIRYALDLTAKHPVNNAGQEVLCNNYVGYGVVQTKNAYDWLNENSCDSWQPPSTQGGCATVPRQDWLP